MAEDFISGRHGKKTAKTLHPLLEKTLADTYGVVLYQEQVMQITSILAGFSLGKQIICAAMGHKDVALLNSMKEKFVEGALEQHQIPRETSESIFEILHHFAGYGFNKSHSVAYALVAYQTAYLKAHWPAEFFAAFLSSVAGDLDKLSWYITVCRERNIKVLPPDVNASMYDFSVEDGAIRFGMNGVKSVGSDAIAAILNAREKGGKFTSILDFCKRVSTKYLNRRVLENLHSLRCL
jgi:DNA polymerase-3 subunit alpha